MARIGIIGTGRMGVALGTGWIAAQHNVALGSRHPDAKANVAQVVKGAQVLSAEEAAKWAEIVVIAVPYTAAEPFAHAQAVNLRGKLVIDITNPFDHLPDNRIAGAEITEKAIGAGARVVAAFKDNFAATIAEPVTSDGITRDVHFAGGSETDKQIVTELINDLGFRPIDCGPLKNARVLDAMVPLMLELDRAYGGGNHRSSWKFLA